jgi:hypothetical protein
MTENEAMERMLNEFERPPETLEDFELWLLHRAHRPEEFSNAADCARAWGLTKDYRACLASKGGR